MGYIAVTYTFTNGTTASASQVNQNFTDLINGLSDGTKNLNVSALTTTGSTSLGSSLDVVGATTLDGNVTLGDNSGDDVTVTGSLASTIPVKTTYSYDIGSATIGLRSVYLGSSDSAARSTRVIGGTVASSWTMTLPTSAGTDGYTLTTNGSGVTSWHPPIDNFSLTATCAASALTVAVKTLAGTDASATDPIYVSFRNTTVTSGVPVIRKITGALSMVVSSGSTLGHVSGVSQFIYVSLLDNAGTVELAVSKINGRDTCSVVTTTAEGGAGAADSGALIYSTTARTSVPWKLMGRLKSNQAAAGTWSTAIEEICVAPINLYQVPALYRRDTTNAYGSTDTKIRRFTNTTQSLGTGITITTGATTGDYFTINEDGVYSISYTETFGATASFGISMNTSSTTTSIATIGVSERLAMSDTPAANASGNCSWTGRLIAGDIIRPHTDGNAAVSTQPGKACFSIQQLART